MMFAVLYFVVALATSPALATEPVAPVAAPAAPVAGAPPVAEAPAAPVAEEKKEEVVVFTTDTEAVSAFVVGQYTFGALLLCTVLIFVNRFTAKKKAE
jgi:hypothetical protein